MLVIIKICNCIHINHVVSYYIPPMFCKEKEPEDQQLCIAVDTISYNKHDADPLDNSSNKTQLSEHALHDMGAYLGSQK